MEQSDEEQRTIWCGNVSNQVTEEMLYELFLQAAPLQRVKIPRDRDGRGRGFAFVTVKHVVSVEYVTKLLNGTRLCDSEITLKPRVPNRDTQHHQPQFVQQAPVIDYSKNFDNLMQMGAQLKFDYPAHSSNSFSHERIKFPNDMRPMRTESPYDDAGCSPNYDRNLQHSHSSQGRWERPNYRDRRHNDDMKPYKQHNRYNDQRSSANNRSNYHGRKYQRH